MIQLRQLFAGFRFFRALLTLSLDTDKVDQVIVILNEIAGPEQLGHLKATIRERHGGPEVERAFRERPLLGRIDIDRLRSLPVGTMGRTFADHLIAHGFDPNYFVNAEPVTELTWVAARLRETHDLWHLATGMDTSPAGEGGLQAFYLAQTSGRMATYLVMAVLFNAMLRHPDDMPARIEAVARGWWLGRRAKPLLAVRWEEMWSLSVEEVRGRLGIDLGSLEASFGPTIRAAA